MFHVNLPYYIYCRSTVIQVDEFTSAAIKLHGAKTATSCCTSCIFSLMFTSFCKIIDSYGLMLLHYT